MLRGKEIRALRIQGLVGHLCFTITGPLAVAWVRGVRAHKFSGLEAVRRVYREAMDTGRPVVVCANHLTMFDSIFLQYALCTVPEYLADFRRFSWNIPAVENFKKTWFLRALTYIGKTVPIDRRGDPAHLKRVLGTIKFLLLSGDSCTIFPEGGRSRTGRVEPDKVTSGVGNILRDLERPIVVCVYLRGRQQETWGYLPVRGDTLHLSAEAISPTTESTGLRGSKDLARQVIMKIKELENRYFDTLALPAGPGAPTGT